MPSSPSAATPETRPQAQGPITVAGVSDDQASVSAAPAGDGVVVGPTRDEFGGLIGAGSARTIRARWHLSSVGRIRKAVIADLQARGVDEGTLDEVAVVVSELVTNSFQHATPLHDNTLRVHWTERAGVVEIEVSDGGGASTPVAQPAAPYALTGRGLRMVRSFAHEWGVAHKKGAVTVWAALGGPSRRRA
jgi:serine/threonine-protein kinase RsbW